MNKKKKLVLFDGSSLAYRAFYALQDLSRFKNKNGLHTNALYAFHLMVTNALKTTDPTHALVAWDAGKTTFRTEMFREYKGNRSSMPPELKEQMPFFNRMLEGFGISHYELPQYEADDIIGTLAKEADASGFEVIIISGDHDLTQLVTDNVTVAINKRGMSDLNFWTPQTIQAEYGITPHQIVDMKGLMGDKSDNYPGVTGIGEKTALQLIQSFGSVEGVYENLDKITGKKRLENLKKDKDYALLSKQLAQIDVNAPLQIGLSDIKKKEQSQDLLSQFYHEMNFNKFLSELQEKNGDEALNSVSTKSPKVTYTLIKTNEEINPALFEEDTMALYVESLEKNYHEGTIIGLSWGNQTHRYVIENLDLLQHPLLKEWLADPKKAKIVFDAKRTGILLHRYGLQLQGVCDDVLIGSYLIHAKDLSGDLAEVANEFQLTSLSYDEQIYGKGKKRCIPEKIELMFEHLASKIVTILALQKEEIERLEQDQMTTLYREMELPLSFVLMAMELKGITADAKVLRQLQKTYGEQLCNLEQKVYNEAGSKFNINSTQQLSDILFQEMGLPGGKKLKGRAGDDHVYYSTAQGELEKFQGVLIVDLILQYRQLSKLQSTYIEGLQNYIHEDGKIHTRFIQTLTTTGRLSSADPNLQNIPIRSEEGRQIRQAFKPSQLGWKIFSADYSQIELRVLAHVSGDEHLKTAFKEGKDIHAATASKVLNKPESEITANDRRAAKAVNFGIVYGISDYGLSQNLGISRPAAKDFITRYFDNFPRVQQFMTDIVKEAKEKGYVETLCHRRRYLPDINAKNYNIRSFAERTAMNSPIQGSAADIIKIAMLKMNAALKERNFKSKMLLQVHDELIFEGPEEEMIQLESLAHEIMENAITLSVPLLVDCHYGDTWYEAK